MTSEKNGTERRSSALVLFSGGQDSTTCLAWALSRFDNVETLGIAYGQRHAIELECRQLIRARLMDSFPVWGAKLGKDHTLALDAIRDLSDNALTSDREITTSGDGLPTTFVPGRNLIFLTFAAALAYQRNHRHLVGGMCETDYSGYPDCRDDTLKALQVAINLGMDSRFVLHTPLMWLDKAGTWTLADSLGGEALLETIIECTHTCYRGDRSRRHPWGFGCGDCPACVLRAEGHHRFAAKAAG